jgi:Dolichyl-phosphate-mannose-protein mannosyltransferase
LARRVAHLVPVLAIWAAAATVLAIPVRRVVDWFVMTDELLYERLAFSVARTGSPLPALHGMRVPEANQLYPILLGAVSGDALVPDWLVRAHTVNAILMTSVAVPAYLVGRRLIGGHLGPYAAAALTVLVPWLVLSSFVLSEATAYPAFVWAVYLLQRTVDEPSDAADLLALAGLGLALLARTQFAVLLVVAPLAIVMHERSLRRSVERHRLLAGACAVAILAGIVLSAAGHNLFGAYNAATQGSLLDAHMPRAVLEHAGVLALGLGLLPAVLGAAWLGARARASGAALVAILAIVLLLIEVASFDLRFGDGLPRDRYLFYAAPLLLVGFVGALADTRPPLLSLAVPLAVVVAGLALAPLPLFDKLNADTPVSTLDDYIRSNGGRTMLVGAALLLVAIAVLARLVLPRRLVAVVLVAATAAALVGETAYAFDRLFRVNGTSGRPITLSQGVVFDWIDRTIGPNADVTMIPYAQIQADYWATAGFWWDLEFWNRSVTRAAYPDNRFAEIQSTFPKIDLQFDWATGTASESPSRYVAESDEDARFRVRGETVSLTRSVRLIDAGDDWQADWVSRGLDDDGFTIPGRVARVRIYPLAGQRKPTMRSMTFHVLAHSARLGVTIGGTTAYVDADHDADVGASVCVPPHGFATVRIRGRGTSRVWGDLGARAGIYQSRIRGMQIDRISLADETSPC